MKRKNRNIICAWVLLLLFAVGQYMVFSHTHYKQGKVFAAAAKAGIPVFKDKCDICDVMHHTYMELTHHVYFTPAVATLCHYTFNQPDIQFIQLVLASGRAPPVAIS